MNKKKRKIVLCLVAAALVLAVGATVAYLAVVTGTKTNAFSSNKYLKIQMREPLWDGYNFGELNNGKDPDGSTAKDNNTSSALGVNAAKTYVPGQTIPKNPQVKNTGNDSDGGVPAYVALKVTYQIADANGTYSNKSYTDFKTALLTETGLDFQNGWTLIKDNGESGQLYLYGTATTTDSATGVATASSGTALNPESTTEMSLFTKVPISSSVALLSNGLPPAFKITVQAYAVQSANVDPTTAAAQLITLAN